MKNNFGYLISRNTSLFYIGISIVLSATLFQILNLNIFGGYYSNQYISQTQLIPLTKLEYQPKFTFVKNIHTFQYILDEKYSSAKSAVLHKVLNNTQKRKTFEYVLKKTSEFKLPAELALIPIIESGYNPHATSYKGASGIWQLMPSTARLYGVSAGRRSEMQASTKAALLYLKKLYQKFGNWEFAIAAYNAGDGKVIRALRKNSHAKSVAELKLPRETRNYVLSFNKLKRQVRFDDSFSTIESKTA